MLSKKKKEWWDAFTPRSVNGFVLWLDDPAIASNIIEDGANRVSQWFDISGNGNNFPQSTGADQGLRSGSDITYDGVSEFQGGSAIVSNLQTNEGEFFFVFNDLEGAGQRNRLFNFGTLATDNQDEFRFTYESDNQIRIEKRIGGVVEISGIAVSRIGKQILNFSSNGSSYKFERNGTDLGIPANNNGVWTGDVPLADTVAISALIRSSSQFDNNSFNSVLYYNRQLTTAERLNTTTFLNNRFNIF